MKTESDSKPKVGKILKNFGFLTMGKTLGDLFVFILFVVISRKFGQEGIGNYSFAIALTGFFMVLADFGLTTLSMKVMSRHQGNVKDYFSGILTIRIPLTIVSYTLLIILSLCLPFEKEAKLIIAVIGAYQLLYAMLDGAGAVFVAHEKMHYPAIFEFSAKSTGSTLAVTLVLFGDSLVVALIALPLVTLIHVFIAQAIVARNYGRAILGITWTELRNTLEEAVPYALWTLLSQLAMRADVVIIGLMIGTAAAGTYNAAYRPVFLLLLLAYFASVSILPLASKLYVESRSQLTQFYHDTLRVAILLGLPATVGIWLIAQSLIELVFGPNFVESILILKMLAVLLLIVSVRNLMGVFLTACDKQTALTRCQWTSAWTNVVGNLILIPLFGIRGAAIATLFSESLQVVLLAIRLKRMFGWPQIGSRLMIGCVGVVSFCVPLQLLSPLSLALVIPTAMIIYIATLMMFRDFRINEGRAILGLIKS